MNLGEASDGRHMLVVDKDVEDAEDVGERGEPQPMQERFRLWVMVNSHVLKHTEQGRFIPKIMSGAFRRGAA